MPDRRVPAPPAQSRPKAAAPWVSEPTRPVLPEGSPHSPRFCSPPKKALDLRGRLPGPPAREFIPTRRADLSAQTHPFCLGSGQHVSPRLLSACRTARLLLPRAEQVRQHHDANSRGAQDTSRPHSSPRALRPAVLRGRLGAPEPAAEAPKPRGRSAGRAGSSPSARGPGPNGGSQVPAARSRECHGREAAPAKFPGANGLPLRPRGSSSFRKQRGGCKSAVASRSRRGRRREAPVAWNHREGKRKAPGIYNQNVGWPWRHNGAASQWGPPSWIKSYDVMRPRSQSRDNRTFVIVNSRTRCSREPRPASVRCGLRVSVQFYTLSF